MQQEYPEKLPVQAPWYRQRRTLIACICALAVIVVGIALAYQATLVRVPDVTDMHPAAATAALADVGLEPERAADDNCSNAEFADEFCTASATNPPGGARVRRGTTVVVSVLPRAVDVPEVAELDGDAAATALRAAGLTVRLVAEDVCNTERFAQEFCVVARQEPATGSLAAGNEVVITLAPIDVEVPLVTDVSADDATELLASVGLVSSFDEEPPAAPDGTQWFVKQQSPAAGATVHAGQAVRLTLDIPDVAVPEVVGVSATDAINALRNAGFVPEPGQQLPQVAEGGPELVVTAMAVDPGTRLRFGSPVRFTWGVRVPDLIGQTLEAARAAGGELFTFSVEGRDGNSELVTSLEPAAGTVVEPGSALTLRTRPEQTVAQSNAVRSASNYLSFMPFSRTGLIRQLEFEGFSRADATYAVDEITVDWNEQAARSAQNYLNFMAFSRAGLIRQLEFEGFTREQAVFGVDAVGL